MFGSGNKVSPSNDEVTEETEPRKQIEAEEARARQAVDARRIQIEEDEAVARGIQDAARNEDRRNRLSNMLINLINFFAPVFDFFENYPVFEVSIIVSLLSGVVLLVSGFLTAGWICIGLGLYFILNYYLFIRYIL
jgi:hypothetical protein